MRPLIDRPHHDVPAATLTTVQRRIVTLVVEGLTNQAIADRLGLERAAVSQDVATILWRLGLASRSQIALWALEQRRRSHPCSIAAGSF
jgi:DNA-binding NarL/FixJ family response regulator